MTVSYDPQVMHALALACQAANDELQRAQDLIQAVRSHDDWGCKEKESIDDLMGECKRMINTLCEQQSSFLEAVKIVESELNEAEDKVSGLFHGVDNVIAGILSIPAAVAVTSGSGLLGGIKNAVNNVINKVDGILSDGFGIGGTFGGGGGGGRIEADENIEKAKSEIAASIAAIQKKMDEALVQGLDPYAFLSRTEMGLLASGPSSITGQHILMTNGITGEEMSQFIDEWGSSLTGDKISLQEIYQQGKNAVYDVIHATYALENPLDGTSFETLWEEIKNIGGAAGDAVGDAWDYINGIEKPADIIGGVGVVNAWENIIGNSSPAEALQEAISGITSSTIKNDFVDALNEIKEKVTVILPDQESLPWITIDPLDTVMVNELPSHIQMGVDALEMIDTVISDGPQLYTPPSVMDVLQMNDVVDQAVKIGETVFNEVTDVWGDAAEVVKSATEATPIGGKITELTDLFENIPVVFGRDVELLPPMYQS